jgi:hypothetical protein
MTMSPELLKSLNDSAQQLLAGITVYYSAGFHRHCSASAAELDRQLPLLQITDSLECEARYESVPERAPGTRAIVWRRPPLRSGGQPNRIRPHCDPFREQKPPPR